MALAGEAVITSAAVAVRRALPATSTVPEDAQVSSFREALKDEVLQDSGSGLDSPPPTGVIWVVAESERHVRSVARQVWDVEREDGVATWAFENREEGVHGVVSFDGQSRSCV